MRLQPFVRHPEGSIPELENSTACEPAAAPATAACRLARFAARLLRLGRLGAAWLVASLMIGASAQAVQIVGPHLHVLTARVEELRSVVRPSERIADRVRKLVLDQVYAEAQHLVLQRARHRTEAVGTHLLGGHPDAA